MKITALAKALKQYCGDAPMMEDQFPNNEKPYPQITLDTSYSVRINNKVGFIADQKVYISLWHESTVSEGKRAEALAKTICENVHLVHQDGCWIEIENFEWIRDKETGLSRYRFEFKVQQVN